MIDLARHHQAQLIRLQAQMQYELTPHQIHSIRAIPSVVSNIQDNNAYLMSGYECLNQMVQRSWIPAVCWTLIRRDFLQKNALRFLEGVQVEDQLFYIQLLTCEPDVIVMEFPQTIYHYRIRQNSTISQRSAKYILDHLTICAKIQEWSQAHDFNKTVQNSIQNIRHRLFYDAHQMFLQADLATQAQLSCAFTHKHTKD